MAEKKAAQKTASEKSRTKQLSLEERLIKALTNPLRVELLDRLNEAEWSPRGLSDELSEGLSQVSYHIKVLKDYKLIELTRTEPRRGAVEHFYRATERAFVPSGMARNVPKSAQHIIGSAILEKIDKDVATSLMSGKFFARPDWHVSWTPIPVDGIGRKEAEKLADDFVKDYLGIGAKSANRIAQGGDGSDLTWTTAAVLVFGSEEGHLGQAPRRRRKSQKSQKKKKGRAG